MADENTMLRGCRTTCTPLPEDPVPGMAYVPFQQWSETYEPARALDDGTLFPVLNKPFYGRRGEPCSSRCGSCICIWIRIRIAKRRRKSLLLTARNTISLRPSTKKRTAP